jgi:predicted nucleotidyltransferase
MNKQTILARLTDNFEEIRRCFSVKALFVFGSAARDEAADDSDIDVLVEFNKKAGFDTFMDLKFYLEELLQAPVDLVTDKALRPRLRKAIEQEMINVA